MLLLDTRPHVVGVCGQRGRDIRSDALGKHAVRGKNGAATRSSSNRENHAFTRSGDDGSRGWIANSAARDIAVSMSVLPGTRRVRSTRSTAACAGG